MKHFTDEAWLDFARNLLPPDETSRMRAHLDGGCEKCAEVYGVWEAVSQIASRESDYDPEESVVNAVKRAYAARSWKPVSPLASLFAEIVFDSFLAEGAMAGIRSISSAARHMVYRSGRLTIDVRLDAYGGMGMTIAGQVLEASADSISAGRCEVSAVRRNTTLARTATNAFGEFQIEIDQGRDLQIRLDISGRSLFS